MDVEGVDGFTEAVGVVLEVFHAAGGGPLGETIAARESVSTARGSGKVVWCERVAAVVIDAKIVAARFDVDVTHDAGGGGFVIAGVEKIFLERVRDGATTAIDDAGSVKLVQVDRLGGGAN